MFTFLSFKESDWITKANFLDLRAIFSFMILITKAYGEERLNTCLIKNCFLWVGKTFSLKTIYLKSKKINKKVVNM